MSGPKLTAMIVFGTLSFLFAILFSLGLNGTFEAVATGIVVTALVCVFIWFAKTRRHAFARGFLGLGAVCIIVPFAALAGFGEQVAEESLTALQTGQILSEDEVSLLMISSIFASAGLVFGLIVGLILVLIGGLMHRPEKAT